MKPTLWQTKYRGKLILQKANEERLKVVSQEPLAGSPDSKQPESRNVPWNN